MKLGSHNSMTYLPPKKWWLYPFRFIAKCQSKPLHEQYEVYNARLFDFRIAFTEDGTPEFRHGLMAYKGNVDDYLKYLNKKKDVSIRLLLEEYKDDNTYRNEELFKLFCKRVTKTYKDIHFLGGHRKWDFKEIYHFDYSPSIEDKYSSMNTNGTTGTILDDWWPWLYARFHNKKNLDKGTNKEFLMIDFVNIQ